MKLEQLPPLPICDVLNELRNQLHQNHELVLEAPPGAGKTTLVPIALLDAPWRAQRKIVMLEPRRVAAKTAANRMAALLGETVGQRVGYTIRLERKTSPHTIVEVVTEGVLTRRLQQDPELSDTALVIFDEFHERNIHSDLGLALCLQSRELFRDGSNPLKLLVMSATLDAAPVAELLGGAARLTSAGTSFPVEVFYAAQTATQATLIDAITTTVTEALARYPGDALVFLPGQKEINQLRLKLQQQLDHAIAIMPLHGGLTLAEQQDAISPLASHGKHTRKVVLATDIAESSLTIEGVRIVVDSGFTRKPQFEARTGMARLHTVRISQASAKQRAGRAGRLTPGVCFRLWCEQQQGSLLPQSVPEILQTDLTPLALQLLQWGVNSPTELQWLDSPNPRSYQQALKLLRQLGALNTETDAKLTCHGERMATLPTHPRLAHLLIVGEQHGAARLAAQTAALLTEPRPRGFSGSDLEPALDVVRGVKACPGDAQPWFKRCQSQSALLLKSLQPGNSEIEKNLPANILGLLIASAFPDRIARKRDNSRTLYQLSNGRAVKLVEQDPLAGNEWLAVAEVGGFSNQTEDRIYSAVRLDPGLFNGPLAELKIHHDMIGWQQQKLVAQRRTCVGAIVLATEPLRAVTGEQRTQATVDFIRSEGLAVLPWTDELEQWRARINLIRTHQPGSEAWPDLSDTTLLNHLESWLAPFINDVDSLTKLQKVDLKSILMQQLPWPLPSTLDELAPARIQVPSGSKLSIDYRQSPPVLEVKLQEMFGCSTTPTVVNGKVAVLIHLLSPARRPLQITQDLAGFWRSSYQDVKKEMKGRYPKHPWPDDPTQAVATRHTKKRLEQ